MDDNQTDVSPYFKTQPEEAGPRIEIAKEGRKLEYSDLEKMTVKDLTRCDFKLLGKRVYLHKKDMGLQRDEYLANISAIGAYTKLKESQKASDAVTSLYTLIVAFASGGV